MMRFFTVLFFSLVFNVVFSNVEIKGFAPKFIGEEVTFYEIEDYLSRKEKKITSSIVKADSSFSSILNINTDQKIVIRFKKNVSFMYVQPNASYQIFLPEKNSYEGISPNGNIIDIVFLELNKEDVNYKILSFDRWVDEFLQRYIPLKYKEPIKFIQKLDTFKLNAEKAYSNEENVFFKTYVKFSFAQLENISYKGARNRYEKYDFFIKTSNIHYQNEKYMDYIITYYEDIMSSMQMEISNRVYLGLLKNSPYLMIKALSNEYSLSKNRKLTELVLIKILEESFTKQTYPSVNILASLDSIAEKPLYKENGLIAKNVKEKITDLIPGSKAPDFLLIRNKDTVNKHSFVGKHTYIQFVDPNLPETFKEVDLLKPLVLKYSEFVNFVTVYVKKSSFSASANDLLNSITWKSYEIDENHPILKSYKVTNYPTYVLMDAVGEVVDYPALKPSPNGVYETIEKTFTQIRKVIISERQREERNRENQIRR